VQLVLGGGQLLLDLGDPRDCLRLGVLGLFEWETKRGSNAQGLARLASFGQKPEGRSLVE
jgi:hypothetical protein